MVEYDFFKHPILNSPYLEPTIHHRLDKDGQPTNDEPIGERRKSDLYTPVPKAKRGKKTAETADLLDEVWEYDPTPIINEIRLHVRTWRDSTDYAGATSVSTKLLLHWRDHEFASFQPFFCQREAVETVIWLTEVAKKSPRYRHIWKHIEDGNGEANPGLFRLCMKMATGAGKTTVMAMLIAWHTLNTVRSKDSRTYSKAFLIIAPGITIKDRLRVLDPSDPDSYFEKRELVPADMLQDLQAAKVRITNYHAFQQREKTKIAAKTRGVLRGREGEPLDTKETVGEMVRRAMGELSGVRNVIVINDEAHHCYQTKPDTDEVAELKGDDKADAKENNEAARLWINGIRHVKEKLGVRAIYDLSATPFFLRGSGYVEGTLFPWTISDFSLLDAIECGIVKLPRVPILDNVPTNEMPVYRDLWKHIGKKMPKKGRGKSGTLNPNLLAEVTPLITALESLYAHYEKTSEEWQNAGHDVPPVFIVVCNNTATSQLVYDWIAGYERPDTDDEAGEVIPGRLPLFSNYDSQTRQKHERPRSLLIDSAQLESGEALDPAFRDAMKPQIEQFKREKADREGAAGEVKVTDEELLREVMNTVGEKGRLGQDIRCVVSVSMLTEGWDANTVTHILGVRAFGTQLLCEQVVGRGLRRKSYALNKEGLFDVEYADIMGIPFDFTAKPTTAPPKAPPKTTHVRALKDRQQLSIRFPNVEGYRTELPPGRIEPHFTEDSRLRLTTDLVSATKTQMSGVVGDQAWMSPAERLDEYARPQAIAYEITKHLLATEFATVDGPDLSRFPQIKRVVQQWLDSGYLDLVERHHFEGMVTWPGIVHKAAERIFHACQEAPGGEAQVQAVIDRFNPEGDTRFVSFNTSKVCLDTKKSHVSHVVEDSTWEGPLALACEVHPKVVSYVKNQGLGFDVPYRYGGQNLKYIPDFIIRIDDGRGEDDLLNLVAEMKGFRDDKDAQKASTMRSLWVPGVNNLERFGRWAFTEFTEVFGLEDAFDAMIEKAIAEANGSRAKNADPMVSA